MTEPTPIETLAELVSDPAYRTIADGMAALRQPLFDNAMLFAHVTALAEVMPRLEQALAQIIAAAQPEPDPVTPSPEPLPE